MNYKTIFMLAVIATAAFVAIGSATPTFAQNNNANDQSTVGSQVNNSCNGATSEARCGQTGQNQGGPGDDTQTANDINFN
jgi:hypothetical protein